MKLIGTFMLGVLVLSANSCTGSERPRSCLAVKSETRLAQTELKTAQKRKAQTCKERQRELGGDCAALESFTNAALEVAERKLMALLKESLSACVK